MVRSRLVSSPTPVVVNPSGEMQFRSSRVQCVEDPDDVGRKAFLSWLSRHVNKDVSDAPAVLWHYTDANGLRGILESDRLWATNTRFLNDSTEFSYGIDLATRALAAHDASANQPETRRFLKGLSDPRKRIIHDFLDRTAVLFVTCFCTDGDLLSQWRAYSGQDSAGGYALGFETPGALPAWAQTAPGGHDLALRKVLYDPVEQEAVLQELISVMVAILEVDPTDVARQNAFARHLVDGLVEAATWCKHPAFKEEQEWRLVYLRSSDVQQLPLLHRPGRGLVVPYVQLDVPRGVGVNHDHLPITRINCGPSPDPDLKQRGVGSLLSTQPHHRDVTVEGSPAPLRL